MASNFPTSLDSLTNPSAGSSTTTVDHASQHANANDAIEAIQAKVGVNDSAISSSLDYRVNAVEDSKADDASVVHDTGDETIAGVKTFSSDPLIPDEAYGVGWNGSLEPPTKNAVYDKVESIVISGGGLGNVVEDTTPQLGGDLDGQSTYDLNNIINADIEGYADFTEISEPSSPSSTILRLWAESQSGFGQLHFKNSSGLDYELGRDNIMTVRNNTGSTISKGQWVYINGSTGVTPTVALAKADSASTLPAMGIAVANITNNSFGQIMTQGDVQNVDTSAFSDGDVLYISSATAGAVTTTRATGTNQDQRVGVVVKSSAGAGIIAVLIGGDFDPSTTQTLTNKTLTSPKINENVAVTATATELNYTDGVTSAIQTQLDAKAPLASPTFTGTVTLPVGLTGVVRTDSGVVSVDTNVTDIVDSASAIAQGKVELATDAEVLTGTDTARAVTPASIGAERTATVTLTNKTLTSPKINENVALTSTATELNILDGATLSTTELNYVDGVTSAIQTQLDAKLNDTGDTMTGDLTMSSTSVVLTPAPGADVTESGIIATMTAGESLVFGDVVYIKSDGKMGKGDADAIATSSCVAMALGTIANDATGSFLFHGFARQDSWTWTVGGLIYLSTTPGGMTQTAPNATDDVVQVLGVATHADRIWFSPSLSQVEVV